LNWTRLQRRSAPYIFTAPFFIWFAVFGLFPIIYAFYLSLHHQVGLVAERSFVGFQNYVDLILDERFRHSLWNTTYYGLASIFIILPVALALALALHSPGLRFKGLFRIAFFVPLLTSSVVVAVIFALVFDTRYGLINNYIVEPLGFDRISWLQDGNFVIPALVLMGLWKWTGINSLYYLAGLQNAVKEIEEAARIDGAGPWSLFRYVTFPQIRPVILFTVILAIIGSYNLFAEPYLLLSNSGDRGLMSMVYLFNNAFAFAKFTYASAIGYILFFIILILSLAQLRIFRVFGDD
jgi:ABC-type sugar transport system permease subunit